MTDDFDSYLNSGDNEYNADNEDTATMFSSESDNPTHQTSGFSTEQTSTSYKPRSDLTAKDSDFLIYVMVGVVTAVVVIVLIVLGVFITRSRRRSRRNVEISNQTEDSTVTTSVVLNDRGQHLNGVHQALYGEDSILPILVIKPQNPDSTANRNPVQVTTSDDYENDEVFIQTRQGNKYTAEGANNQRSDNVKLESKDLNAVSASSALTTSKEDNHDYEKTFGFFDYRESEQPAQKLSVQKEVKQKPAVPSKPNIIIGNKDQLRNKTAQLKSDSKTNKTVQLNSDNNEETNPRVKTGESGHTDEKSDNTTLPATQLNKGADKDEVRNECETRNNRGEDTTNKYENASARIKRAKFKDAKLLKAVPPPCNLNTYYVNVPDQCQDKVKLNSSSERQSSVYENPDRVPSIQHSETEQEIKAPYVNIAGNDEKRACPVRKTMPCDYENSDAAIKLKLAIHRAKWKRGLSESSIETASIKRSSLIKPLNLADSVKTKDNESDYLEMNSNNDDNSEYLSMNSPLDNDTYYTPMSPGYCFIKRLNFDNQDKQISETDKRAAAPKPCGSGWYDEYANYSSPPIKYVNVFRSRSTDDIYTDVDQRKMAMLPRTEGGVSHPMVKRRTNLN